MSAVTTRAETPPQGFDEVVYDDKITRAFAWATMVWGIVGMLVGVIIAIQIAYWPANVHEMLSFGRLRPLHTNAVIFAFAGNAIFTGVYYSTQRLMKARMFNDKLSWLHFWGWQRVLFRFQFRCIERCRINQGKYACRIRRKAFIGHGYQDERRKYERV